MAWHARLPASGAKRWMNCPGSVRMAERMGSRGGSSSFFALEGTAAHALGSTSLKSRLAGLQGNCRTWLDHWIDACTDGMTADFPLPHEHPELPPGFDPGSADYLYRAWERGEYAKAGDGAPEAPVALFKVTPDMADHVDGYVELCLAELERLNEMPGPPALVGVEERLDMSWLHPALGGTADFWAAKFLTELVVIDLKFGKGVTVEVENNEQELTYVVGVVRVANFDGERVTLWIAQPRKEHEDGPFRKWECTMDEVRAHEAMLLERALQTERPNAPLRAGDWCKFCPCAGFCPELADRAMLEAQLDFSAEGTPEVSDVQEMDDAELVRVGRALPLVEAWTKAAGARLLERAMSRAPKVLEHYKIVRKRSNRRWIATEGVAAQLAEELGMEEESFYEPRKLLSGPKVEKMPLPKGIKRAEVKAAIEPLMHKPPGGLTLAFRDDPRDEVDPTDAGAADFEPVGGEDG